MHRASTTNPVASLLAGLLLTAGTLHPVDAAAAEESARPRFGLATAVEQSAAINRDRPELSTALSVVPRLSFGERASLSLAFSAVRSWLDRAENPYDCADLFFEAAHSQLLREPRSGVALAGRLRAYAPTSKASRNSGNLGQVRAVGMLSRAIGPVTLGAELNAQKYFHRTTTWDTAETQGSEDWYRQAGREDYLDNNASFGLGETLLAGVGLDRWPSLAVRYSLLQSRHYDGESHSDQWGSSLTQQPRATGWNHAFRFSAELSYELVGAAAAITADRSEARSALSGVALSLAYDCLAPQLQNGGRTRSLNPFNPLYGQLTLGLSAGF